MSITANEEFKPKIVAFCCNWCSYAGADLAGSSRLVYPADVKIIRVPCSCRVNPMFILRAFEKGADGVILCGCHPGDCHYSTGNYYARRCFIIITCFLNATQRYEKRKYFYARKVVICYYSCLKFYLKTGQK